MIEASPDDTRFLREGLASGLLEDVPAPACLDTLVRAVRLREGGVLVSVEQGGEVVSRELVSLDSAMPLIESWLLPPAEVSLSVSEDLHLPYDVREVSASAEHRVSTRFSLDSTFALGSDLSLWAGPELSAAALLTRSFWFGGGLGVEFWATNDRDGARIDGNIPVVNIALRFGGRLRFGERISLDLGAGLGISLDPSLQKPVNPYGELLANMDIALGRNISLLFGLFGRMHMIREADRVYQEVVLQGDEDRIGEPSALSLLSGELRVGIAYSFGGRR